MSGNVLLSLSLVLAIVGTILLAVLLMPDKKRAALNGFGKIVHDIFNFKGLLIESVMKYLYVFATCFFVALGFLTLFQFNEYTDEWVGYVGFAIIIFAPIVIRLMFESMMMFILLVKNTIQINNKLKNQNEGMNHVDPFNQIELPKFAPKAPQAPYQVPQQPYAPQAPYQAPQQPYAPAPQQPYQAPQAPQQPYQAPRAPQAPYQAPQAQAPQAQAPQAQAPQNNQKA